MEKDGLNIDKIDEIWITHVHSDHAQVEWLAKKLNCPVRCHPDGVDMLCANAPWEAFWKEQEEFGGTWLKQIYPNSFILKKNLMLKFGRWLPPVEKKRVKVFKENEVIDLSGCHVKIIFAPGHVKTENSFLVIEEKILISGDIVRVNKKVGIPSLNNFTADLNAAMHSIKKYYKMARAGKIESIAPGHGPIINSDPQRIIKLLLLNIENGRKLKRRAKIFFLDHDKLNLIKLANLIDELLPSDIPKKEKLLLAFILAESLGKT